MRLSKNFIKNLYLFNIISAAVMSIGFVLMPLDSPDPGNLGLWLLIVILPLVVATFGFRLNFRMRTLGMMNLLIATNYILAISFTFLIVLSGEAGRVGRLNLVYLMSSFASIVLWITCSIGFLISIPLVLVDAILSRNKTTSRDATNNRSTSEGMKM